MQTHFDERLHFAPRRHLLLTHTPCHLARVALNSSNDGMGVWPLFCALIHLLDDNDLFAGLAALEDDCDLFPRESNVPLTNKVAPLRTLPGL